MSRVPQTRDAQALNFGVQSVTSAQAPQSAGVLSATAAGTCTLASNCAVANDMAGQVIVTTSTNATWASANVIYGTILSNTAASPTVATVDGWWAISNNATAANPFSTAQYVVLPAHMPFWWMALTDSVASVAGTESGSALGGTEYTASGLGRAIATTLTHSAGAANGTLVKTFTYAGGGSITIGRSALVNSGTAGKNFAFFVDQLNGGTGYVVASLNDTLQITYTITYATVP